MARRNGSPQKLSGYLEQILGSNSGKKIPLYDFDVLIGRSKKAYICSSDPNVSRNHCSLKYTPTGWLIKDLGSVNGTFINNIHVPNDTYIPLNDGCSIFFGPSDEAPEGYRFLKHNNENELPKKNSRNKISPQKLGDSKAIKRKVSPIATNSLAIDFIPSRTIEGNCDEDGYHTDSSISSMDSLKTRIRKANSAQKRKDKKAKYSNNEGSLVYPSTSSENLPFELRPSLERISFSGLNSESENSQSLINNEIYDDWNMDYEDCGKQDRSSEKDFSDADNLNSSSVAVHSNLLKALQKKVTDLQDALKTRNLQLSNTMNENARLEDILKSKETAEINIKEDFKKLIEDELICNICTEIFIKPITLGCSHTFCQHCIFEWKKKKRQCPMCRERIETETTVLFMDNFINKAIERLDPVSLEKRLDLMRKREELQKKKPKRKKSKNSRRRNGPTTAENSRNELELLRSQVNHIQSYSDDIQIYVDAIDQLINDDEEDDEEMIGSYEDRFSRCHRCGRPGHWQNACPYL